MVTRNACFPHVQSGLSRAIAAHKEYAAALDDWHTWLAAGDNPSNAEQLTLYKLIQETIARRRDGGAWATMDKKVIPEPAALDRVLDRDKYDAFGATVMTRRLKVEKSAKELCDQLDSDDLIAELEASSYEAQLAYLAELTDQLSASNVGMLFMRRSVNLDQSPLPVVHPDRITRDPINFLITDTPAARRAAKIYIHASLKMLPALVKDKNPDKLTALLVDFIGRYFPEDKVAAATLEEKFNKARAWLVDNPDVWKDKFDKHGRAAGWIQVFFEVADCAVKAKKISDHVDARSIVAMIKAIVGTGSAILASPWERAQNFVTTDVGKRMKYGLSLLNAVMDVITACIAVYDAKEAYEDGDLSVAAGQAMQGVGLAAAGVIAGVDTVASLTGSVALGALVPGLQVIALAAVVAVLAGALLVAYTQDSPFESWLQNCWFGDRWDDVEPGAGPDKAWFKAKRVDGTPDIGRQVSTYLSVLFPLRLTATIGEHTPLLVSLSSSPILAYADSQVDLWRLADNTGTDQGMRWTRVPVFNRSRTLGQVDDPRVFADLAGDPPDQRVIGWVASFGPLVWSQGTNAAFDMTERWVEMDVTIPARFAPQIVEAIGGSDRGQNFSFPYTVRGRCKVAEA
ncbi:hypothetical protein [Actinoplanes sp. NPDC049599]|uniref:hypothetical protein n=1 Tax=Actinoplanes sp. NPDC049599 TaxID=3363903 RepID=UPI00378ACF01